MSLGHRVPALLAAVLSSAAVLLAAFAGSSCDFLTITAISSDLGESLLIAPEGRDGFATTDLQQTSIGVLCARGFYDRDGDDMWELSRVFLILGLLFGSLAAALAWAVSSYVTPTNRNWKGISFLAAITSILQVPVFVLFEAEPCSDFQNNQKCSLGSGALLLIASDILYIAVCLCTQCLDPPLWALELDFWKVEKHGSSSRVPRDDEYYDPEDGDNDQIYLRSAEQDGNGSYNGDDSDDHYVITRVLPASKSYREQKHMNDIPKKSNKKNGFFSWFFPPDSDDVEVLRMETESTKEQELDECYVENQMDDSHRIMRDMPEANAPKDDAKTPASVLVKDNIWSAELRLGEQNHPDKEDGQAASGESITSNNAILADLQAVETIGTTKPLSSDENDHDKELVTGTPSCISSDKIIHGVRKLTQSLKRDVKRRKSRRKRMGYSQMLDDTDYNSDDDVGINSPPLEVKFPVLDGKTSMNKQETLTESGIQFQMEDVFDDEDEDIYLENEAWVDLTAATSAGIQKAVQEEYAAENQFNSNMSISSIHSDPEPLLFDSDSEDIGSESQDSRGENSTLSDDRSGNHSGSHSTRDSRSRRRSSAKGDGRRKRTSSPVESIKSHCSLLHTTINEETEEDIENELGNTYSLARTKSAPEPRSLTRETNAGGILNQVNQRDQITTLHSEASSYDQTKTMVAKEVVTSSLDSTVEDGDIPMQSNKKTLTKEGKTSIEKRSESSHDDMTKELVVEESVVVKEDVPPTRQSTALTKNEEETPTLASGPGTKHTWTEPDLPTNKTWKDPESCEDKDRSNHSILDKPWKEAGQPSIGIWQEPSVSRSIISDDTSATDETGCLSRTTDSLSENSDTCADDAPRRIVLRSRSFDGTSKLSRLSKQSKSLSPSRSTKLPSLRTWKDASAKSGLARDIRIRRLQKLKGYVPLEDHHDARSPTRLASPPTTKEMTAEGDTPKRRTHLVSPDEKKEDDASVVDRYTDNKVDLPEYLFQPQLGLPERTVAIIGNPLADEMSHDNNSYFDHPLNEVLGEESPEYDSLLEELDLQLIGLRRPIGAEYGDDECSL